MQVCTEQFSFHFYKGQILLFALDFAQTSPSASLHMLIELDRRKSRLVETWQKSQWGGEKKKKKKSVA